MLSETVLRTLTDWAFSIYPWTLTYLLHSTLLLGLAWLVTRRMSTDAAGIKDGIWKIAIVGGIVTSIAQCVIGLEPVAGRVTIGAPVQEPIMERPARMPRPAPRGGSEAILVSLPQATTARTSAARPVASRTEAGSALARPAAERSVDWARTARDTWPGMLLGVWLGVSLLMLAQLGVRRLAIQHLLRGRTPLTEGSLTERLDVMCRLADVPVRVRLTVSDRLTSPIAFGRREICVPRRALTDLNADQQATMLAHELAHLTRRDPAWLLACALIEAVFFIQPLNRLARRGVTEAAEYLCDDEAVRLTGGGVSLAKCLATVATWVRPERTYPYAATMLDRPSPLLQRVQRLLDGRRLAFRPHRALTIGVGAAASLLALYVAPGVRAGTDVPAETDTSEVTWDEGVDSREPSGHADDGIIVYAEGTEPVSASPVSSTSDGTPAREPSRQPRSEEAGIIVADEEISIDEYDGEWIVHLSGERVPRELVAVENGKVVVFGDNGLVIHRIPLDEARSMAGRRDSRRAEVLTELTTRLESLRGRLRGLDDLSDDELETLESELESQYEDALEAYGDAVGSVTTRETKRALRSLHRAYSRAAAELGHAHARWSEHDYADAYDYEGDYDYDDGGSFDFDFDFDPDVDFDFDFDFDEDPDWKGDWSWRSHGDRWDLDSPWADSESLRDLLRGESVTREQLEADGVDLNEPIVGDRTLLDIAVRGGEYLLVEDLIRLGADATAVDRRGHSLLHVAADEGDVDLVSLLLDASVPVDGRDERDRTPLHFAASEGEAEVVAQLVAAGADVSARDERGRTPLHVAAGEGEWSAVEALLDAGADPNARDERDRTPLHAAAIEGDFDVVLSLMDRGADPEAKDTHGRTAATLADRADEPEIADLLRGRTGR